ncbi:hypothetical protein ACOL3H_06510 [Aliarcobacter butzleri]
MTPFKVTFSSLEEAWFENEAIVNANSKEEAFKLLKDCIDNGRNPFTEFNAEQFEVIEYINTKDYEIATDGLAEIPYEDFVQEYYFLPVESNLTDIQKAESSNISKILEIEIEALDSDVFVILERINSNELIFIDTFINDEAKEFNDSQIIKWNEFRNFVKQSEAKYIVIVKNGKPLI